MPAAFPRARQNWQKHVALVSLPFWMMLASGLARSAPHWKPSTS
jgi:hypothetical protein